MDTLALRDIHLPEPVSFWPPAPGWWLLAGLLALITVISVVLYGRARRLRVYQSAAKMLAAIKQTQHHDPLQTVTAVSVWLRRVAISTAPRANVAGLNGQAWLAYLDTSFKDRPFSEGVGRCLADAQYRKSLPADTNLDELLALCERWLKQQKNPRRKNKDTESAQRKDTP
jgi:hypothetical protein